MVVAGNSIQTPRLLLHSPSNRHPNGLANSSGQVGKNYMRHLTTSCYALFEKPAHAYRGISMMGWPTTSPTTARSGALWAAFSIETIMLGPAFASAFIQPGSRGPPPRRPTGRPSGVRGWWSS